MFLVCLTLGCTIQQNMCAISLKGQNKKGRLKMTIRKVAVIGSGAMGSGIAQVSAQSGYEVKLHDVDEKALQASFANIERSLQLGVERQKLTREQKEETLKRIRTTADLRQATLDGDLIIEAVFEHLELKKDISRVGRHSTTKSHSGF